MINRTHLLQTEKCQLKSNQNDTKFSQISCISYRRYLHLCARNRYQGQGEVTRTTRAPVFWDTPSCPMITHTSDSHKIPSQNKTSQSYKFKKIAKNSNFKIWWATLHPTHFLKLLGKMHKHKMEPTRTVGTTERTRDAGRRDGGIDGVKPIYPTNNFVVGGIWEHKVFHKPHVYLLGDMWTWVPETSIKGRDK